MQHHRAGVSDAGHAREHAQPINECASAVDAAAHGDAEYRSRSGKTVGIGAIVATGQLVERVRRQPREIDRLDLGLLLEPRGDRD